MNASWPQGERPNPSTQTSKHRQILVCQNVTCREQGSAKVLQAFQTHAPHEDAIIHSGCLGECGSGPMVLVLPEKVWYDRVKPKEVATIVTQHLQAGQPVQSMLFRKYHPRPQSRFAVWQLGIVGLLGGFIGLVAFAIDWVSQHQAMLP